MKKISLIIILLFINTVTAQQSGRVIYKVLQDANYDNSESVKKMMQTLGDYYINIIKRTNRHYEIAKDFQFFLDFNLNESVYYWDETMRDEMTSKSDFFAAVLLGGGEGKYYYNKTTDTLFYQAKIDDNVYKRVVLPSQFNQFKITKQTDTILGYPVIKAEKGLTKIWFTPDIPLPFGPNRHVGFPGLVLKFQFKNRVIIADKIILYNKKKTIKKPEKGAFITESDLLKEYRKRDAAHFNK